MERAGERFWVIFRSITKVCIQNSGAHQAPALPSTPSPHLLSSDKGEGDALTQDRISRAGETIQRVRTEPAWLQTAKEDTEKTRDAWFMYSPPGINSELSCLKQESRPWELRWAVVPKKERKDPRWLPPARRRGVPPTTQKTSYWLAIPAHCLPVWPTECSWN